MVAGRSTAACPVASRRVPAWDRLRRVFKSARPTARSARAPALRALEAAGEALPRAAAQAARQGAAGAGAEAAWGAGPAQVEVEAASWGLPMAAW